MIYLDTNIIVRLAVGDVPEQADAVVKLIEERGDELYLPPAIFTEAVFVLSKIYGMRRADVADSLAGIVPLLQTAADERSRMLDALTIFASRRVDIVDAWLAAETLALGHRVASFDRDLARCGADVIRPA